MQLSWRLPPSQSVSKVHDVSGHTTALCEHYLLLKLHALISSLCADIALDAKRHADFKLAVIATAFPINLVRDGRIFVDHADAMCHAAIPVSQIYLGYLPGPFRELAECHTWAQQVHVEMDLRIACFIKLSLLVGRSGMAYRPCPGDIRAVAIRPDHVGIER